MRHLLLTLIFLVAMPLQAAETRAAVLYYRVSEPGVEPYLSRWLVTDKFVRIDEGDAADNFILLDRKAKTVYSVVHGDRTVLDIPHRLVDKKPAKALQQKSRTINDDNIPPIEGKKPLYRELHVNGELCYSTVSVDNLLPEAVKAMGEFRQVMAGEHAKNLDNTPVELQQPCELALHIFNPLWANEKGLPIQEWDRQGQAQALLNYKVSEGVDGTLFNLPAGYRHYQTQGQ
ncbi:MAG TPA: hypothetical protein VGE00_07170 [Gammaproteobacteria bacterium]